MKATAKTYVKNTAESPYTTGISPKFSQQTLHD